MAREPDVTLLVTASGSLAHRKILVDISSKHCLAANASRAVTTGVVSGQTIFAVTSDYQYPVVWFSCKIRFKIYEVHDSCRKRFRTSALKEEQFVKVPIVQGNF